MEAYDIFLLPEVCAGAQGQIQQAGCAAGLRLVRKSDEWS